MTQDLELRIIDAITPVVEQACIDQPRYVVRYTRPAVVLPEDCPVLCVWLMNKDSAPRTTDNDDAVISIGVSYQVEAVARATTLVDDPDKSRQLIRNCLAIQAALRDLFQRGWAAVTTDIPEAYDGFFANADYTPPTSLETGLVEGYAMTARVLVQERR